MVEEDCDGSHRIVTLTSGKAPLVWQAVQVGSASHFDIPFVMLSEELAKNRTFVVMLSEEDRRFCADPTQSKHPYPHQKLPAAASAQMAEWLRKVAELFPANLGFEFAIYYKRRS